MSLKLSLKLRIEKVLSQILNPKRDSKADIGILKRALSKSMLKKPFDADGAMRHLQALGAILKKEGRLDEPLFEYGRPPHWDMRTLLSNIIYDSDLNPHEKMSEDQKFPLIEWLLQQGASINMCKESINRHEDHYLHTAAKQGQAKIVGLLLDYGADPNQGSADEFASSLVPDRSLRTPLLCALIAGESKVASILAPYTHHLNEVLNHSNGETLLTVAARWGQLDAVKSLVMAGADVHIKTKTHKMAWEMALQEHHIEVADFLKGVALAQEQRAILLEVTSSQEASGSSVLADCDSLLDASASNSMVKPQVKLSKSSAKRI